MVSGPTRLNRVFDKNPFTRKLSPRTGDYMASEDGLRTAPARCATPVTTAESEILALFKDKDLAAFEDCANRTLESIALAADTQSEKQQSEFPAGVPRPHVTRNWGKWLEKECIERGLTDVRHGKFTPGLFAKKWSARALEPVEELPEDATYKDKQAYRRECIELEKRLAFNKRLAEQKQTWWRDKLNEYFELITGSMERTQPGLREVLRERYHCGDGYYDGVAAMEYIKTWLKNSQLINPQYEHYEKGHSLVLEKRLAQGCSDREFQAVARRWAFDINPFLRAPYAGDAMGEFIVTKIMPAYQDSADRIVDELRREGVLHDYESVIDRCSTVVNRRASKASSALSVVADELQAMFAEEEELQVPAAPFKPAGGPKKQVDPRKDVFCPGCPHKTKDGRVLNCLSDPSKTFEPTLRILRRMVASDPGLAKLKQKRAENAKALGMTAKALPDVKPFPPGGGSGNNGGGGGGGSSGTPSTPAVIELVELVAAVEAGRSDRMLNKLYHGALDGPQDGGFWKYDAASGEWRDDEDAGLAMRIARRGVIEELKMKIASAHAGEVRPSRCRTSMERDDQRLSD